MKLSRFVILFLVFAVSISVMAQEPLVFENQQQQERFDKLTLELRCLVRQNQNLADSDAPLAHDVVELKTELERIREQVQNIE